MSATKIDDANGGRRDARHSANVALLTAAAFASAAPLPALRDSGGLEFLDKIEKLFGLRAQFLRARAVETLKVHSAALQKFAGGPFRWLFSNFVARS